MGTLFPTTQEMPTERESWMPTITTYQTPRAFFAVLNLPAPCLHPLLVSQILLPSAAICTSILVSLSMPFEGKLFDFFRS